MPLSDGDSGQHKTRSKRKRSDSVEPPVAPVKPTKKKPGPKPKAKPKAAPTRKPKVIVLESSDSDATTVPEKSVKPKSKKTKKDMLKSDSEKSEPEEPVIVFMVPEVASELNQRVQVKSSTCFEDAVELFHETIGCVSVARKPTLAYKLSTSTARTSAVNLRTADDWKGLTTDWSKKIKSKKDLSITILVLPENYMFSLRKNKNVKKDTSGDGKKKKGKMTAMDLDNDDDEDGDGDDDADSIGSAEKQAMSELDAEYRKCVKCGTGVLCKIDRSGTHVHLTFPQRRAWAVSIACGTRNVTKMTPPQSELFSMFHGKAKEPSFQPPAAPYNPYAWLAPAPVGFAPPPGFAPPHPGYSGYPQMPVAPPQLPDPPRQIMLSSDPPDDSGPVYPSITDFIESLIAKVPQRGALRDIAQTLDALRFFDINEIVGLTVEDLGSDTYGNVVVGDAQYLLTQVAREVKRLDKLARRARHQ